MKLKKELLDEIWARTDVDYGEEELSETAIVEIITDLLKVLDKQDGIIDDLQDTIEDLEDDIKYNYRRVGGIEY